MKQYFRFSVCLFTLIALLTGCSCLRPDEKVKTKYEYTAIFFKVIDGDTFEAFFQKKMQRIRLADIDCFEKSKNKRLEAQAKKWNANIKQALTKGTQSEIKLAKLLMHSHHLNILPIKTDAYGRIIAYVQAVNSRGQVVNVNQYMLYEAGCNAFPDESYYNKKTLIEGRR